jgi:hypothetical protein
VLDVSRGIASAPCPQPHLLNNDKYLYTTSPNIS